jgi:hypothetical protein
MDMRMLFGGTIVVLGIAVFVWIIRRFGNSWPDQLDGHASVEKDRSRVRPYPYVYVNADGSARELHPDERDYLETRFQPGDGNMPYIKSRYSQKDGWGDIAGFLKRSRLPKSSVIFAAPAENPSKPLTKSEEIRFLRDKGIVVTEDGDGTWLLIGNGGQAGSQAGKTSLGESLDQR